MVGVFLSTMLRKWSGCLVVPWVALVGLILSGCGQTGPSDDQEVVSRRYIHKYGYDVSESEWSSVGYPGQVITNFSNGVIETACYENGQLHGETTSTHPHSRILSTKQLYERGRLVRETRYTLKGLPVEQVGYPDHSTVETITWYPSGTPKAIETHGHGLLVEGKYYNRNNELVTSVDQGAGERIIRNWHGLIESKEQIVDGRVACRTIFYPHGIPQLSVQFDATGALEGEKRVYAPTGEAICVERYHLGKREGQASYYQNGSLYLEVGYHRGLKHGLERRFLCGETLIEDIQWYEGRKLGLSNSYSDGVVTQTWFYNDRPVSKKKYRDLCAQAEHIAATSRL